MEYPLTTKKKGIYELVESLNPCSNGIPSD